jgi:DNA-binding transcriptional ArsR family regulator
MATPKRAKVTHALLAALMHPVRRQILRAMEAGKAASPRDLAAELGKSLDNIAYHMRVLAECGAMKLVRTEEVAGTTKHVYRLSASPVWVREVLDATEGERPGGS